MAFLTNNIAKIMIDFSKVSFMKLLVVKIEVSKKSNDEQG